ncbi:MAG: aldo/keto reductase [Bryobacterales bacterium]|nr:aldo/keto reductase [Bryobacterales bacterium]
MNSRREILALSLAAAVASKASAAPAGSPGEWRNRQPGMAYRRLGRTGFMISEFVMGGNLISPTNYEHVLEALDRGLNYLDTAPAYGNLQSEKGYARVIAARNRDSFFLNTKISMWDINRGKLFQDIFLSLPETERKKLQSEAMEELERRRALDPDYICDYTRSQRDELRTAALANVMEIRYGRRIDRGRNYRQLIIDSLDSSLRRLGTDHVDLMMCPHGASTPAELLTHPEIFDAFETLKKAGKVRHLGVSAHNDPAGVLEAAARTGKYSAAMVAYNIINHRYVDGALEKAHRSGMGVIAMKVARPVFNGRNNGTPDIPERVEKIQTAIPGALKVPQKAYVWALRNPLLGAVISEMGNAAIMRDNLPLAAPKA